jgi:hypothetical protein
MKTIQSEEQRQELRKVIEKIVEAFEKSHFYTGKLSIDRVLPPAGAHANSPAGYPHLLVQEEIQKKILGIIPCNKKNILFIVKEGFFDIDDKGKKEMIVLLRSKSSETFVKRYLEEYGKVNQVTDIIYRT